MPIQRGQLTNVFGFSTCVTLESVQLARVFEVVARDIGVPYSPMKMSEISETRSFCASVVFVVASLQQSFEDLNGFLLLAGFGVARRKQEVVLVRALVRWIRERYFHLSECLDRPCQCDEGSTEREPCNRAAREELMRLL